MRLLIPLIAIFSSSGCVRQSSHITETDRDATLESTFQIHESGFDQQRRRSHLQYDPPGAAVDKRGTPKRPLKHRVILFTLKGCIPCERFKRTQLPILRDAGWDIGTTADKQLQLLDARANADLAKAAGFVEAPMLVLVKNGKPVPSSAYVGPHLEAKHVRVVFNYGEPQTMKSPVQGEPRASVVSRDVRPLTRIVRMPFICPTCR